MQSLLEAQSTINILCSPYTQKEVKISTEDNLTVPNPCTTDE